MLNSVLMKTTFKLLKMLYLNGLAYFKHLQNV